MPFQLDINVCTRKTDPAPPPDDYVPDSFLPLGLTPLDELALGLDVVDLSTPEACDVARLLGGVHYDAE